MTILSAAVIGLGQAGSRFDEEPRGTVWSHAGAYLALPEVFQLVAGADIDAENRARFARRVPDAALYENGARLMAEVRPDVVSICTPPNGRAELVTALLDAHRPRALICEKPLEVCTEDRQRIVARCASENIPLIVNYNRRYASPYRVACDAIRSGEIGDLVAVTVASPNRLWSIGSHAVNLLTYLADDRVVDWAAMPISSLEEDGEPAADVLCRFSRGVAGRLITMGRRAELIFEADAVGSEGRVRIEENGRRTLLQRFEASETLTGYRTLSAATEIAVADKEESPFVNLMTETHATVVNNGPIASAGDSVAAGERLLDAITELCGRYRAA